MLGVLKSPNRELLWEFTKRLVAQEYKGSVLGMAWKVLSPLLMLLVYTVVFSVFLGFRVRGEKGGVHYATMIFSGMVPFRVLVYAMNHSTGCIRQYSSLVKRVVFPVELLPLSVALAGLIEGLFALAVLLVMVLIAEGTLHFTLIFVPLVLVELLIFATAISYFLAAAATLVRDIAPLIPNLIMALLFLTPLVWPLEMLNERFQRLEMFNPAAVIVLSHRNATFYGEQPLWLPLGVLAAVSVLLLMAGRKWFDMQRRFFPEVL